MSIFKRKRGNKTSKKWYADVRQADGNLKRVPLCTNKQASQQMLAELVRQVERQKAGLCDPVAERNAGKPLAEHVADYGRYLRSKGDVAGHVKTTTTRILAIVEGCKFVRVGDIQASAVSAFLAGLREDKAAPPLPTGQDVFTVKELATVFGVSKDAVHKRLLGLDGVLTGKRGAKLIPRDVALALSKGGKTRGKGTATTNAYLVAVKAFAAWLVKDGRTGNNPLAYLGKNEARGDVRRVRRTLSPGHMGKLLNAARTGRTIRGLTGEDRYALYRLLLGTGFRVEEAASLKVRNFQLDGPSPAVLCEAAYTKNGEEARQPIRTDLANLLREYLLGKPGGSRVWPGSWPDVSCRIVRHDLLAAGVPYRDANGHVFDAHAFRHQFISDLAAAGVHPKTAQLLARHGTITLTMDRYTHVGQGELTGALERLPSVDGALPEGTVKGTVAPAISGHLVPPPATKDVAKEGPKSRRKSKKKKAPAADSPQGPSVDRAGFEPATPRFSVYDSEDAKPASETGSDDINGGRTRERTELPSELAGLAAAWDQLPSHLRTAIAAMTSPYQSPGNKSAA